MNYEKEGKKIWLSLNQFQELKENVRFKNDKNMIMQNFLDGARIGKPDPELLSEMNKRLYFSEESVRREAGPNSIWVVHTKKDFHRLNNNDFNEQVKLGMTAIRIVAKHTSAKSLIPQPNREQNAILYKIYIKMMDLLLF